MVGRLTGRVFLGVVIGLVFCVSAQETAAATNLVTNGDFETVSSSASIPQNWSSGYWGSLKATFAYPVAGNSSAKAAKVTVTNRQSGDAKWSFQHITAAPGEKYQYTSTYVSNVQTEITAEFKMSNGSYQYKWLGSAPAKSAWGTYTNELTVPTGAVAFTVFHLISRNGNLTIDNVSVVNKASTPPPPPAPTLPTCTFGASPTTITEGSSSNLSWSTTYASSTSINAGIGAVAVNGSQIVTPSQTTTYTLTATGPGGSKTCSTTVTVKQPAPTPAPTCSLEAAPTAIEKGQSSTLSWTTTHTVSASLNNSIGSVATTSSTRAVSPTQTTTYVLTATGVETTTTCSASVTVTEPTPPPPPPSTNLVQNGTFETSSSNSSIPAHWGSNYWGSLKATFAYPVAGNSSAKAAKVAVTNYSSGDAKWWFAHIPASTHTLYQYTNDYIATVPTNITVEFIMSNGSYQYQWLADAPAQSTWGTFTAQITIPTGATSFTVFHSLEKNGSLTIDNVSVVALPASPFSAPMATLVFDDALLSQYTNGRPILNAAGVKGVFSVITQYAGSSPYMSWPNLTTLKNEGHEVNSHTRTHADLTTLSAVQVQSEVQGSYSDLVAQGFTPRTLVYPYGATSPAIAQVVKDTGYSGARGSYFGLNAPYTNRYALYDIRLDKTSTLAGIKTVIDQAAADKRWLVFELHDILASGGDELAITPTFLQSVIAYLQEKGVQVVTLEEGMGFMNP